MKLRLALACVRCSYYIYNKDNMKKITFFHRAINFSKSGKHNKNGCVGAVMHDLRFMQTEKQLLNHDSRMADKNFIFAFKDEKLFEFPLNKNNKKIIFDLIEKQYDDLEKRKIIKNENPNIIHMRKLQNIQSAIRTKFKRYKADGDAEIILKSLSNPEITIQEIKTLQERFNNVSCRAHSVKSKQIQNYLDKEIELDLLLKSDCNSKSYKGSHLSTIVQTSVYKIPCPNKIDYEMVTNMEYATFFYDFHNANFPDFKLLSVIGHLDELSVNPNWVDTGNHIHTYVSGYNEKEKEYNLISKQKQFAEKFLLEKNPQYLDEQKQFIKHEKNKYDVSLKSISKENKFLIEKLETAKEKLNGVYFGRIWQETVRISINEKLMNKKGLHIDFNYETRNNRHIVSDSKLPQKDRIATRSNQISEQNEIKIKNQMELINDLENKHNDMLENINSEFEKNEAKKQSDIAAHQITINALEFEKEIILQYCKGEISKTKLIENISENSINPKIESELNHYKDDNDFYNNVRSKINSNAEELLSDLDKISNSNQSETHVESYRSNMRIKMR